jgi:hypothetical protein
MSNWLNFYEQKSKRLKDKISYQITRRHILDDSTVQINEVENTIRIHILEIL